MLPPLAVLNDLGLAGGNYKAGYVGLGMEGWCWEIPKKNVLFLFEAC